MRIVTVIFGLIVLSSCGGDNNASSQGEEISGAKIFTSYCAVCHGADGRKGFADAKVLPDSELSLEERILVILNGRGTMTPYRGVLSEEEIEAVAEYTLTLE